MSRKLVLTTTLTIVFICMLDVAVEVYGVKVSKDTYAIPNEYQISGVSFVKQETKWCGPASLTMVLNYWGDSISQNDVGSAVDPEHDGTKPWHMIPFLESRGYVVYDFDRYSLEFRISVMDELKMWVSHDYPIVVRQWTDLSKESGHYRVAIGYDAEKIYVMDPSYGSKAFNTEYFLQLWERNYEYGLVVIGDPTRDSDSDQLADSNEVMQNTDPFDMWVIPPSISIASPKNKSYTTTDIKLTFVVDELVLWMAYSLDNQPNVTITESTVISRLSEGSHTITVYANDTAGNTGTSDIVYFTIETQQVEPLQMWIVATIAIIAGVITAFLVYLAKVKKAD